jgi:hypothetical protein
MLRTGNKTWKKYIKQKKDDMELIFFGKKTLRNAGNIATEIN